MSQAVKRTAANRPIVETRNNWLSLLNFMRFLRRGPSGSSPRKTRLGCPAFIVKARCGVLLMKPACGRASTRLRLLRTAAGTAMRNCRDGRRLSIRQVGRVLRIQERAGCGAQFEARDAAVDAIVEKVGVVKKMIVGGIDADGDRLQAGGVGSQAGEHSAAYGVGGDRGVNGIGHVDKRIGRIGT